MRTVTSRRRRQRRPRRRHDDGDDDAVEGPSGLVCVASSSSSSAIIHAGTHGGFLIFITVFFSQATVLSGLYKLRPFSRAETDNDQIVPETVIIFIASDRNARERETIKQNFTCCSPGRSAAFKLRVVFARCRYIFVRVSAAILSI